MGYFDHFSEASMAFLQELKVNNRRDWFAANKTLYDAEIKEPAKDFVRDMAVLLQAQTGLPHSGKVFRIHRDVRFSKDKTPYNSHLHISFTPQTANSNSPMWFFGQSTQRLSLGCGIFQFDKAGLENFRHQMAGNKGADLIALCDKMWNRGIRLSEPDLKRVPSGFSPDHPHKDVLLRKGFSAWLDFDGTGFCTQPKLVARTGSEFEKLSEVFRFLIELGKP